MEQINQLRQLIRESIQEYIREIDEAGDEAAVRAKIEKTQEAITKRKKILDKEGLDEAFSEYLDKNKMKEMTSEIKMLERSLGKYDKQLKKMEERKSSKTIEDGEVEEEVIDEVNMDENNPESGPQLEEGKKMTAAQKSKKEDIVKGMKKSKSFGKSKDEKDKMQ